MGAGYMCWNKLKTQTLAHLAIVLAMVLAIVLALGIAATPAFAEKPSWAGGNKNKHADSATPEKARSKKARSAQARTGRHFSTRDEDAVRNYYRKHSRNGKACPPGLAKKNNGCMPPGQAKKWNKGQPLPRDVVHYELPSQLVVRLGPPPAGHKYVRVASDILLIAVGTAMVVDAINDLGRM